MKVRKYLTEVFNFLTGEEEYDAWKTLNDAEVYDPGLGRGKTAIYYMNSKAFRDFNMGSNWLIKRKLLPTPETITDTHILLGTIKETNLDRIFYLMQGEIWSPQGEANNLIRKKGLKHTSMSVGDIIHSRGTFYMVDSTGFYPILNLSRVKI